MDPGGSRLNEFKKIWAQKQERKKFAPCHFDFFEL